MSRTCGLSLSCLSRLSTPCSPWYIERGPDHVEELVLARGLVLLSEAALLDNHRVQEQLLERPLQHLGCRVWGSGFGVQGLGFGVQGLGFRV